MQVFMKVKLLKLYNPKDSTPAARKKFEGFAKNNLSLELLKVLDSLSKLKFRKEQEIAAHALIPDLYLLDPKLSQKIIYRLANSDDWGVRELAATVLKRINGKFFKKMLSVYKQWIHTENNYIQRVICVGLFGVKENFDLACKLIEPILKNSNRYVRVNLGPFALSWIYYKDSQIAEKYITKWLKSRNENVLWNIVMIFSQARGKYEPDEALKMIEKVGKRNFTLQKSMLVCRACASVLYNVSKYHPEKVQRYVDENRNGDWFNPILGKAGAYLAKKGIS